MKISFTTLFVLSLLPVFAPADFSRSQTVLHPLHPGTSPFILEISGTWPTDCHPGEQKPLVESFDGQSMEIGFEIIVVHITCNDTPTDFRVLVDLSEAVKETEPVGGTLELRVAFQGETLEQTLALTCPDNGDCVNPAGGRRMPEPGLYFTSGLANQGLLLARQNAGTVIYPLVYDDSGRSHWLISADHLVQGSFFSELLRLAGGDCFGCEPTGAIPEMFPVGTITVLVDRPGVLQVKLDDGLFSEYQSLVFAYPMFQVGPEGEQTLVDLEGRWGISENRGTDPPLGDLTEFFPGAFDIFFDYSTPADAGDSLSGEVGYRVSAPTGEFLGQLLCGSQSSVYGGTVCEFIDPTDAAEPLFLFHQDGPSSLIIEYGRAVIAIGTPPGGRAARLD